MNQQLIECVPNFSEGRDPEIIDHLKSAIQFVKGVKLLHTDMGYGANRTVLTFAGPPAAVVEAAFLAIKMASQLIDMRLQKGTHPRMGATDVCPLVPLQNISMEEVVSYARQLGKKVGEELGIPVYLYEKAALSPDRQNLAAIRSGEYEGLAQKMVSPKWKPDFGPTSFNAKAGATVIGARPFLIAYNVNLDTTSVEIANKIAAKVRESGQLKKVNGQIQRDEKGRPIRIPGLCKGVKAIGWYIDEYERAQVSMNITDLNRCSVHEAFEACSSIAVKEGVIIKGSELIGLAPLKVFLEAGTYFLKKKGKPEKVEEKILVTEAIKELGLDFLSPFQPQERIIEYLLGLSA